MTKILAFSGRKQSGKSTAGEYVVELIQQYKLPLSYKLYSFADPLKQDICINLLGLTHEQCYGTDEDKNSLTKIRWENMPEYNISWTWDPEYDPSGFMTARQVMEFVGTRIFRQIYSNIWIDATISKIKKEAYDLAILLDNRFPNEVDAVLDNDGIVIRLTRNPYNAMTEPEMALDPHSYDWSKFSAIINNDHMSSEEKNQEIISVLKTKGILPL